MINNITYKEAVEKMNNSVVFGLVDIFTASTILGVMFDKNKHDTIEDIRKGENLKNYMDSESIECYDKAMMEELFKNDI